MKCKVHEKPFSYICISPQCHRFRPLCSECVLEDVYYHEKIPLEVAQQRYRSILETYRMGVSRINQDISRQGYGMLSNKACLDKQLADIKSLIDQRFACFKRCLENKFKQRYLQRINKLREQLNYYDMLLLKMKQQPPYDLDHLSKILRCDLEYQRKYFDDFLSGLKHSAHDSSEWALDNDKVLSLLTTLQNHLDDIFQNNENQISEHESSGLMHLLHNNTLYVARGQEIKHKSFKYQTTGITESIYACGNMYVFGQGNKDSNKIFKIEGSSLFDDFGAQLGRQIKTMQVKRKHMSLSLVQNEIFVIGGYNEQEGCLSKCQKLDLRTNKISLVNSLNYPSSHHTSQSFRDRYILKFGGVQNHLRPKIMCPCLIEVYDRTVDEWRVVQYLGDNTIQRQLTYLPTVVLTSDCDLIILGGFNNRDQHISTRHHLKIKNDSKSLLDITIKELSNRPGRDGQYYSHPQISDGVMRWFKVKNNKVMLEYTNLKHITQE